MSMPSFSWKALWAKLLSTLIPSMVAPLRLDLAA